MSRRSSYSFTDEVVIMAGLNSIDLASHLQEKKRPAKDCENIKLIRFVERTKFLSSDLCCILAAVGYFLMVLETELFISGAFRQVCLLRFF